MRALGATWIAFGAAAVLGFGLGCMVELPPDGKYTCSSDADCGGGGFVCTAGAGGTSFCCKPSGDETCDLKDNDCNGVVDDVAPADCYTAPIVTRDVGLCRGGTQACAPDGSALCSGQVVPVNEQCNNLDDDCNGVADNGIDLQTDSRNCGACGVGCSPPLRCESGGCAIPIETNCTDGIDNDGDNARDCADADCVGQTCGTGCVCRNFQRSETVCDDATDNDGDGNTDCSDTPDCNSLSCGTGCLCVAGSRTETICSDAVDNDGDGNPNCADPDCQGQVCGAGCLCNGGQQTETNCAVTSGDEDGDSLSNCSDPDCNGVVCRAGCQCFGAACIETTCSDNVDNDTDGRTDCADTPDCDDDSCGAGCTCRSGIRTETNCIQEPTASGNEDGDANANCADPDCLNQLCRTNSGNRRCRSNGSCQ